MARGLTRHARDYNDGVGVSGGFIRFQPQFFDHLVTHDEYLDFSGNRHGKFVDEAGIARHLLMGDLAFTESGDFIGNAASPSASFIQAQSSSP